MYCLHKGLLMQDWVFRLGFWKILKFYMTANCASSDLKFHKGLLMQAWVFRLGFWKILKFYIKTNCVSSDLKFYNRYCDIWHIRFPNGDKLQALKLELHLRTIKAWRSMTKRKILHKAQDNSTIADMIDFRAFLASSKPAQAQDLIWSHNSE